MCEPSGDHVPRPSTYDPIVSWCGSVPSAFTTNRCIALAANPSPTTVWLSAPSPTKRILVPSGDHDGNDPRASEMTTAFDPSAFMTVRPISRSTTILVPSGDQLEE